MTKLLAIANRPRSMQSSNSTAPSMPMPSRTFVYIVMLVVTFFLSASSQACRPTLMLPEPTLISRHQSHRYCCPKSPSDRHSLIVNWRSNAAHMAGRAGGYRHRRRMHATQDCHIPAAHFGAPAGVQCVSSVPPRERRAPGSCRCHMPQDNLHSRTCSDDPPGTTCRCPTSPPRA